MIRKPSWFNITSIAFGMAFLYLPIAILVLYSFNGSRLVAVWGGWSTRWYAALLHDQMMLDAAWTSLAIALVSASAATVLGTIAAFTLVRLGRFRGRVPFAAMIYAPLVMPEVITGIALLLLFVVLGLERGFWTVAIAHTSLTMCFVTVIVQARLVDFDTSLEEAAMDLGCPPARTFLTITLPLMAPTLAAGFMLAFTLSLDDVVITSFTNGPGTTTLPVYLYGQMHTGVTPEINAVCTILVAAVAIVIVGASLIAKFARGGHEQTAPIGAQV